MEGNKLYMDIKKKGNNMLTAQLQLYGFTKEHFPPYDIKAQMSTC